MTPIILSLLFLLLMLAVLTALANSTVLIAYLAVSSVTFALYAIDKAAARNNGWRTPENTLHLLALMGGWPGALLAQQVFRHKSRKRPFQALFWLTVAVNCVAVGWFLRQ